jgi:hypothetical protein
LSLIAAKLIEALKSGGYKRTSQLTARYAMTQISGRDKRNIREIIVGPSRPRARNLVGTRAVSQTRMRRKVMSWRIARNPLFHASVTDAA